MNSLSPPISFTREVPGMQVTASMAKQDVSSPAPQLGCNQLELIGLGVFFVDDIGGFFLFFSFFST